MAEGARIGPLDRAQRRWSVLGLPIAVIYKYFDDQATYLAVIITYYALFAIFPLLLLATSILGFLLQGDPELQERVLDSALSQFPIIGDQFRRPEGLTGSAPAVVIGVLAALYGVLGLGSAIQNAINIAWAVPRNSRPNPFLLRLRGLLVVSIGGLSVLGLTTLSVIVSNTTLFELFEQSRFRWTARILSILIVGTVLALLLRLSAARPDRNRKAFPGAFLTALLWHGLQFAGAAYVTQVLARASALNQTFGLVLGLMALIFLVAVTGMLGVELNVVLGRHLWPRALLTPFTDSVVLTDADRRAYSGYAQAQRHKGFQQVSVDFPGQHLADQEPPEVTPPGPRPE